MQTIEEIAFQRYLSDQSKPKHQRMGISNYIDWANLGAKEAQRWFPMTELKEIGVDYIFKKENQRCTIGHFEFIESKLCIITDTDYSLLEDSQFKYFRPIERL